MNNVFISYRREDAPETSGRIYDYLMNHLGASQVYKDVYNTKPGVDFRSAIVQAISRADVVLVIIGPNWLNLLRQRQHLAEDFVRQEIEMALQMNKRIIPILVQGAKMPPRDQLPVNVSQLIYRNAVEIRNDPDFPKDMERLLVTISPKLLVSSPRRRLFLPLSLVSIITLVLISFLFVVIIPKITATPKSPSPTATTFPAYYAPIPGLGCGSSGWSYNQGTTTTSASSSRGTCTDAGLQLSVSSAAQIDAEASWNPTRSLSTPLAQFPAKYAVTVTVTNLSGCAGLGFSQATSNQKQYIAFVCSDSTWKIVQYDKLGSTVIAGNNLSSGNSTSGYQLEVKITGNSLSFATNNGTLLTSQPLAIAADYLPASFISLVVERFPNKTDQASALFNTFEFGVD